MAAGVLTDYERGYNDGMLAGRMALIATMWWDGLGQRLVNAMNVKVGWTVGYQNQAFDKDLADEVSCSAMSFPHRPDLIHRS